MFREPAMYQDREAAGRALARNLMPYAKDDPVVLGIPRGAVPMAKIIADTLNCELDICLVRKIGAPGDQEVAIGSVTESGDLYMSHDSWGVSRRYVEEVRLRELQKIKQRRLLYNKQAISLYRRTVIIVDDGIATGCTMLAAIQSVRGQKPFKIVVASPVASLDAWTKIRKKVDDLVIPHVPKNFMAVAQFYLHFPQVTDAQVMEALGTTPLYKVPAVGIPVDCDDMERGFRRMGFEVEQIK